MFKCAIHFVYICGLKELTHYRLIGSLTEEEKHCLHQVTIDMCRFRAGLPNKLEFPLNDLYVYGNKYDLFGNKVIREKFSGRSVYLTAYRQRR
jgi:hypothetical protein